MDTIISQSCQPWCQRSWEAPAWAWRQLVAGLQLQSGTVAPSPARGSPPLPLPSGTGRGYSASPGCSGSMWQMNERDKMRTKLWGNNGFNILGKTTMSGGKSRVEESICSSIPQSPDTVLQRETSWPPPVSSVPPWPCSHTENKKHTLGELSLSS